MLEKKNATMQEHYCDKTGFFPTKYNYTIIMLRHFFEHFAVQLAAMAWKLVYVEQEVSESDASAVTASNAVKYGMPLITKHAGAGLWTQCRISWDTGKAIQVLLITVINDKK